MGSRAFVGQRPKGRQPHDQRPRRDPRHQARLSAGLRRPQDHPILPADSFYEWQRRPAKAGKPASKLPYAVHRSDGQPMAFAGLWEVWRDKENPDAEPLRTCVIITTAANQLMKPIHDRMPVILDPADWDSWLNPDTDLETLQSLLVPAPASDLEAYPISTRVNNVRNDGPELLDPLPAPPSPARSAKTSRSVSKQGDGVR